MVTNASSSTIAPPPAPIIVSSGASVSDLVVAGGEILVSGGSASNITVVGEFASAAPGHYDPIGSAYVGEMIVTDGVVSGAHINGAVVIDRLYSLHSVDASQILESGAMVYDTTLHGTITVEQFHLGNPAITASSIARQVIGAGASAVGVMIEGAASSLVEDGGSVTAVTLEGDSFSTPIYGLDHFTYLNTVESATQIVQSGGSVTGATIRHYAVISALNGAMISDITLSGGLLEIASGTILENPVTVISGEIELSDFTYGTGVQYSMSGHTLTVSGVDGTRTIDLSNDHFGAPSYFTRAADGRGTDIVFGVMCYAEGTLIETPDGPRAVESLAIGDDVLTMSGIARPVRWLGRRAYDPVFARGNRDILPVVVRRGALAPVLGADLPSRDLVLSPLHALGLDGALVPVMHLVNGRTIVQDTAPERIRYVHVELDRHDLLIAEGVPAETFLDEGDRGGFHNAHEYARLYPDAQRPAPVYCAPRIESGPLIEALRARLDPDRALRACIDVRTPCAIEGWAFVPARTGQPLVLEIMASDIVLGACLADRPRPDVQAGIAGAPPDAGFVFGLPRGIDPAMLDALHIRVAAPAAAPRAHAA